MSLADDLTSPQANTFGKLFQEDLPYEIVCEEIVRYVSRKSRLQLRLVSKFWNKAVETVWKTTFTCGPSLKEVNPSNYRNIPEHLRSFPLFLCCKGFEKVSAEELADCLSYFPSTFSLDLKGLTTPSQGAAFCRALTGHQNLKEIFVDFEPRVLPGFSGGLSLLTQLSVLTLDCVPESEDREEEEEEEEEGDVARVTRLCSEIEAIKGLANLGKLQNLNVTFGPDTDERVFDAYFGVLSTLRSLHCVDVGLENSSEFSAAQAQTLFSALANQTRLLELDLHIPKLEDRSTSMAMSEGFLAQTNLTLLVMDLGEPCSDQACANDLYQNLAKLTRLSFLDISAAPLSPQASELFKALTNLTRLQLNSCGINVSAARECFVTSFPSLTRLISLDLTHCQIFSDTAALIAPLVQKMTNLKELTLDENPLGATGLSAFFQNFPPRLQSLSIRQTLVVEPTGPITIPPLPSLRFLRLFFMEAGIRSFLQKLATATSNLETIDMDIVFTHGFGRWAHDALDSLVCAEVVEALSKQPLQRITLKCPTISEKTDIELATTRLKEAYPSVDAKVLGVWP